MSQGPFYACELTLEFSTGPRKIGVIAQDRATASGVWGPEHHELAAQRASSYAIRSLPILTLMDTPGADPYEEANGNNQAHSISRLIAELCNVDVPTLGIIIGQGYSGGAYRWPPATCYSLVGPAYLIRFIHAHSQTSCVATTYHGKNVRNLWASLLTSCTSRETLMASLILTQVKRIPSTIFTPRSSMESSRSKQVREILSRIILKSWTTTIEISAGI